MIIVKWFRISYHCLHVFHVFSLYSDRNCIFQFTLISKLSMAVGALSDLPWEEQLQWTFCGQLRDGWTLPRSPLLVHVEVYPALLALRHTPPFTSHRFYSSRHSHGNSANHLFNCLIDLRLLQCGLVKTPNCHWWWVKWLCFRHHGIFRRASQVPHE